MIKVNFHRLLFLCFIVLFSAEVFGQGETPTTFFLPPKNLAAFNFQNLNLKTNLTPSQDVALAHGTIDINAYIVPILYSFAIKGRIAQVLITPTYGQMIGTIDIANQPEYTGITVPESVEFIDKSGFLDPSAWIRVGLLNAPALNIAEYSKLEPQFRIYGLAGITLPLGNYDPKRRVNLGANRYAFRIATPMVVPLNKNKERLARWEITPNVYFYTHNNEPFAGDTKTQTPLFVLLQHFSKYFSSKFWASIDAGYQYGGRSQIDDLPPGDIINQLAGGVSMGYAVAGPIKVQGSYGRIWFNDEKGHMIRFLVTMALPGKSDREMLKQSK